MLIEPFGSTVLDPVNVPTEVLGTVTVIDRSPPIVAVQVPASVPMKVPE